MDPKELRANVPLNISVNDDNSKYAHSNPTISTNKNKSYHEVGGKMDATAIRPCAIIGPDRVHTQSSGDIYMKKTTANPWTGPENIYRQPPEYPNKLLEYQPNRNISPRQTFQENMQRIMVPPTYSSIKNSDEASLNNKVNLPQEGKYCDVPYNISVTNEHKSATNSDIPMPSVNPAFVRSTPHYRWPSSVNVRPQRHYGVPEFYQYPEYPSCVGPRPATIPHQHRIHREEAQACSERMYQEANIRFKPYPISKEKLQQARYEYNINNYSNTFHPPTFPPHKFDLQKSIPNHPYPVYHQAPLKYLDRRLHDSFVDGYQRPNQQLSFNPPYHNQMIPPYGPISGNCVQSKPFSDLTPKQMAINKLQYDTNNKIYLDLDTSHKQGYPVPENIYYNDINQHVRNEILLPNNSINMHSIPKHQLYRRENMPLKHYEYNPHYRNLDHSVNLNYSLTRLPLQYSPNSIAISPSDSNTSNDTTHTIGTSQEDCGYVSQSSTTSVRSLDTSNLFMSKDMHRRQDYRIHAQPRNTMHINSAEHVSKSKISSSKKNIDVRQFLQMWNEGEEEPSEPSKETSNHQGIFNSTSEINGQEQLYVLGSVPVPSEELGKYEHIQKFSKLPENIKGFNNIEILNQYEQLLESPKTKYKITPTIHKDHFSSSKRLSDSEIKTFPRPVSPLDVEAKISQSVIHKEVGCNFEIKPCSPEMLNVEVATPIQSILGERLIEKVVNPITAKSPILSKNDDSNINLENRNKITSCELINNQYSANSYPNVIKNNNYTVQDLESNSGICLASLPRLDNDIELNFPEINQQFIKANQLESSEKSSEDLFQFPNADQLDLSKNANSPQLLMASGPEKEVSKLSKYRKNKKHDLASRENLQVYNTIMPQQRIDSVIIKNPDTVRSEENRDNTNPSDKLSIENNRNSAIEENKVLSFETAIDFSLNKIDDGQSHPCIEKTNEPNFLGENISFYSKDVIHEDSTAKTLLDLEMKHIEKQETLKEDINIFVDTVHSKNDTIKNGVISKPLKSSENDKNENVNNSVIEVSSINQNEENSIRQDNCHLFGKENLLETIKNTKVEEDIKDDIKLSTPHIVSTETDESLVDNDKDFMPHTNSEEKITDTLNHKEATISAEICENEVNSEPDFDVIERTNATKIFQMTTVEENAMQINRTMELTQHDVNSTNMTKEKDEIIKDDKIPIDNNYSNIEIVDEGSMVDDKKIECEIKTNDTKNNIEISANEHKKVETEVDFKIFIGAKNKIVDAKTLEGDKIEIDQKKDNDATKDILKETKNVKIELNKPNCKPEKDSKLYINNIIDKTNLGNKVEVTQTEIQQDANMNMCKENYAKLEKNDYINCENNEISDFIDTSSVAKTEINQHKNEIINMSEKDKLMFAEVKSNTENVCTEICKEFDTYKTANVIVSCRNEETEVNEMCIEINKNSKINSQSEELTLDSKENNILQCKTKESAHEMLEKVTIIAKSPSCPQPEIDVTFDTKDCQSVTTPTFKIKKLTLNNSNLENLQTDVSNKDFDINVETSQHMGTHQVSSGLLDRSQCLNSKNLDLSMLKKDINKVSEYSQNIHFNTKEDNYNKKFNIDEDKITPKEKTLKFYANQEKYHFFGKRSHSQYVQKLISFSQEIYNTQKNKQTELNEEKTVFEQTDNLKTKKNFDTIMDIEEASDENCVSLDCTKRISDKKLRECTIQENDECHEILLTDLMTHYVSNEEKLCEPLIASSPISRRHVLKRSLSESALSGYRENTITKYLGPSKRKKSNDGIIQPIISEDLCNIIQTTRRNSISTLCNEDNVYILIDNNFIIAEENDDSDKIYYSEMLAECRPDLEQNDSAFLDATSTVINDPTVNEMDKVSELPNTLYETEEEPVQETWVEDVACIETVVSDDITDDFEEVTSPEKYSLGDDSYLNQSVMYCDKKHLDKIKNIYGNNMCTNDTQILQTLYMTPQMNVNKTLSNIESHNLIELQEGKNMNISIENISSNILDNIEDEILSLQNYESDEDVDRSDGADFIKTQSKDFVINNESIISNKLEDKDESVHNDDSVVHSYKLNNDYKVCSPKSADSNYSNSCSPEVSSTTSEEKNSSILLKITNFNGSMVSETNQNSSPAVDKISYKLTEKNDYQNYNCTFSTSRTLITKAAQKYIPPLKDTIGDLKVKLTLPQHRLNTLKQLKVSKVEPKIEKTIIKCVDKKIKQDTIPKKLKPKFEDVLKSIDEIQFKKHKDKVKRGKSDIPKVVIKKNQNGAHYTSSKTRPIQESYNPDLTGRKWQPWVFLEKNNFIDKMATRKKVKAIYCHRKNTYVLEEKFRKYKSIYNANFVITQPSSDSSAKGLKYTIRLKHK